MLFDDRLATVLRSGAAGEQAARTQYRQLLDLLGSGPDAVQGPLVLAAFRRLREIEAKAMSYGSGPDGGYLVPDEIDTEIGRRLSELSPIR